MKLINIAENLEQKLNPLISRLSGFGEDQLIRLGRMLGCSSDLEHIIRAANILDPTGDKATYTYWIVKVLNNNTLRLPDDAERLTGLLALFDRIKKSTRFEGENDINKYKTFTDFEQVLNKYQGYSDTKPASLRQWEQWVKKQGVSLFYKDEMFEVIKYERTGQTERMAPTKIDSSNPDNVLLQNWYPVWAIKLEKIVESDGKPLVVDIDTGAVAVARATLGTSYCVQNPQTAQDNYLDHGPLFGIFKGKSPKGEMYMLCTDTWDEIMNADDNRLVKTDATTAYFLCQYLIQRGMDINPKAKTTIKRLINSPRSLDRKIQDLRPEAYQQAMDI